MSKDISSEVDAATKPPLSGMSPEDIYAVLTGGDISHYPQWPSEPRQLQYTGGSGVPLLNRARRFVEAMEKDMGGFPANWRGLDYGCGWGRIASFLLSRGSADQLDMCDAWEESLELARQGGFRNKIFKVSSVIQKDEIASGEYDFCYAMSIFTHLNREAFEKNVAALVASLKRGGRFFFTVRFEAFIEKCLSTGKVKPPAALDKDGFWNVVYPGQTHYGETAVSQDFVFRLCKGLGQTDYLGEVESEQHLFRIIR